MLCNFAKTWFLYDHCCQAIHSMLSGYSQHVLKSCRINHHLIHRMSSSHSEHVIRSFRACYQVIQSMSSGHLEPVIRLCNACHQVIQSMSSGHSEHVIVSGRIWYSSCHAELVRPPPMVQNMYCLYCTVLYY